MTLARPRILRDHVPLGRPRSMTEDQIREALLTTEGNISAAAKIIGVAQQTLSDALHTWAKGCADLVATHAPGRPPDVVLTREEVLRGWEEGGRTIAGLSRAFGINRFTAYRLAFDHRVPGGPMIRRPGRS